MLQGALPGACHCPQSAACWDGPPAEVAMRQTAVSKGDNYLRLADGVQRVERLISPGFYTLSKLQALVYDTLPPNTFALGFTPCTFLLRSLYIGRAVPFVLDFPPCVLSAWVLCLVMHFPPGFSTLCCTFGLGFIPCAVISAGVYNMCCTFGLGFPPCVLHSSWVFRFVLHFLPGFLLCTVVTA